LGQDRLGFGPLVAGLQRGLRQAFKRQSFKR
jgi:hypothetical protein